MGRCCNLSKRSEPRAAIQRNLSSLERWAGRNTLEFSKEKCKVLKDFLPSCSGQEQPQAPGHAGGHPVGKDWTMSQQRALAGKADGNSGCLRKSVGNSLGDWMLPFSSGGAKPGVENPALGSPALQMKCHEGD